MVEAEYLIDTFFLRYSLTRKKPRSASPFLRV